MDTRENTDQKTLMKSPKRKLFDWPSPSEVRKSIKPKFQSPRPLFDATNFDSPLRIQTPKVSINLLTRRNTYLNKKGAYAFCLFYLQNRLNSPLHFQVKRNSFATGPLKPRVFVEENPRKKRDNSH